MGRGGFNEVGHRSLFLNLHGEGGSSALWDEHSTVAPEDPVNERTDFGLFISRDTLWPNLLRALGYFRDESIPPEKRKGQTWGVEGTHTYTHTHTNAQGRWRSTRFMRGSQTFMIFENLKT